MRRARLCRMSAALATLLALPARAEPREHKVEVSLDAHIGQSTAPYFTAAFPRTSGYGAVLVVGGRALVAPRLFVGVRVPLVLMRVEQPAGALYAEAAWANPELSVTLERPWLERADWSLRVAASLAVGAPFAEHDPAQLAGRALRLANALEGFSEPALYTPGVVPVTPAGIITLENARWKLSASLGVPLLFRVANADLPPESRPRRFALVPVTTVEAQFRVTRWFSLVAAPRLTTQAIAPVEDHAPAVQLLAAGAADFHFGDHLTLSALLQAPAGGALGGSTVAGGLRLAGAL